MSNLSFSPFGGKWRRKFFSSRAINDIIKSVSRSIATTTEARTETPESAAPDSRETSTDIFNHALKEELSRGRARSRNLNPAKEKIARMWEGCLIPSVLPSQIRLWRGLYCPNDFEPQGETKNREVETLRYQNKIKQVKEVRNIPFFLPPFFSHGPESHILGPRKLSASRMS